MNLPLERAEVPLNRLAVGLEELLIGGMRDWRNVQVPHIVPSDELERRMWKPPADRVRKVVTFVVDLEDDSMSGSAQVVHADERFRGVEYSHAHHLLRPLHCDVHITTSLIDYGVAGCGSISLTVSIIAM
jgi:hypothetical protein